MGINELRSISTYDIIKAIYILGGDILLDEMKSPNNIKNTAGKNADTKADISQNASPIPAVPTISIPKGGGAIRGIGEKFSVNPVTGTGSFSVPIFVSPARSSFGPQLSLSYNSGSGNGPFGLVSRQTCNVG